MSRRSTRCERLGAAAAARATADTPRQRTKGEIAGKISGDFQTAQTTVNQLEKFRPVYTYGQARTHAHTLARHRAHERRCAQNWNLEEYRLHEPTVKQLEADMVQQGEWHTDIDRNIRQNYEAGIFQVDSRSLKESLLPICTEALAGMKEVLLKIFHTRLSDLHTAFQRRLKQLDERPRTLQEYAIHVEKFAQIRTEASTGGRGHPPCARALS
jgi:hypothetical protein